ncbi:MAG: WD40/YVTN/BNR-like repeat-containing protein, partial [Armatimonadota bacterium]
MRWFLVVGVIPIFWLTVLCFGQFPTKATDAPESDEVRWQLVGPGGGGWIQSVAFDPKDPNTIYVGCDVGGFYVSFDGGKTFEIRNKGLRDYFVECIAVHPLNPDIILLGTQGGIFRTTDKGKTWQWMRDGFPPTQRYSYSAPIGAICFDPQNPDIVYAGIGRPRNAREGRDGQGQGAIYRSTDGGVTWQRVDGGQLPKDAVVSDIEVKPDDSKVILVATNRGLFRSDDGGKTWLPSNDGLSHTFVQEIAFAPSQPNRVYLTLLTTSREGQTWNGGVYR